MIRNPETGGLEAYNFEHLQKHVPELKEFDYDIHSYQFKPPIDSSDMQPELWARLVELIAGNYAGYGRIVCSALQPSFCNYCEAHHNRDQA